jgi:hypothetical protein
MSTINRFLILILLIISSGNFSGCQMETNVESDDQSTHQTIIIEPGNEGFLYKPNSIGIDTTIAYNEGAHEIPLDEEMIQYSIRQQTLTFESDFEFNNDTVLHITAKLYHRIERGKASVVHFNYGPYYADFIKEQFIIVYEPIMMATGWTEVDSEKGEELENNIYEKFAAQMSTSGISIDYLELGGIDVLNKNPL